MIWTVEVCQRELSTHWRATELASADAVEVSQFSIPLVWQGAMWGWQWTCWSSSFQKLLILVALVIIKHGQTRLDETAIIKDNKNKKIVWMKWKWAQNKTMSKKQRLWARGLPSFARPCSTSAAFSLVGTSLTAWKDLQSIHTHLWIVDFHLAVPWVYDINDSIDCEWCLCYIGGHDDFSSSFRSWIENLGLQIWRQLWVHWQNQQLRNFFRSQRF